MLRPCSTTRCIVIRTFGHQNHTGVAFIPPARSTVTINIADAVAVMDIAVRQYSLKLSNPSMVISQVLIVYQVEYTPSHVRNPGWASIPESCCG